MTTTTRSPAARTHITIARRSTVTPRAGEPAGVSDPRALSAVACYLDDVADALDRTGASVHTVEVEVRGSVLGRLHLHPDPRSDEELVLHWFPDGGWSAVLTPLAPDRPSHDWRHLGGHPRPDPRAVAAFVHGLRARDCRARDHGDERSSAHDRSRGEQRCDTAWS
ncbi:DUF6292 family protein [Actinokineospora bangkokensis]|uniref:DUF6292 domain-containing protein n=1 Tax=Actinokineospora bangkokensis TaxID=1193682 RepID=A0A1Q9LR09_9PSEU|nr:DUF6292 family protein [Actinokineospora bangkokensis]OLR94452.1 hypothetical protein BJP25_11915 [Actinokineospora bangkokensis]